MGKKTIRLLSFLLLLTMGVSLVGCSKEEKKSEDSLVYLSYGTGMDEDGEYNRALYGMNGQNDVSGADPFVFYVSEDDDPVSGGYYYMYDTSWSAYDARNPQYHNGEKLSNVAYLCYRSKDLYHWELSGAMDGGYSLGVDEADWAKDHFWAPEVMRSPADGKYYMYFTACDALGLPAANEHLYIGIAVADTPSGPFDMLYDINPETGKRIPTIDFHKGCNTKYNRAVIDPSPFLDDDGELYLYFNLQSSAHYPGSNSIWGVRMKTMIHADYSTVACLAKGDKITASSVPGQIEEYKTDGDYFFDESGINEGPFMIKQDGKYYLTYSANGYEHTTYSVHQAVSDSPLSGFRKLSGEEGNPVLNGNELGYMNGTAHHSFVRHGNEVWIAYHRHDSTKGYDAANARSLCVDRVNFVENAEGLKVLSANGPSKCLQWLPEGASEYQNLVETAEIQVSTGSGVQYLNDGVLPFYAVTENHVLETTGEDVTITLKWQEPVTVSSVMIYNAKYKEMAFSNIADIRFKLAEKPEWSSKEYDYAVIKNLAFPERYTNEVEQEFIACAPAVAEFNSIKITEIRITIDKADRLLKEDRFGERNTALNLSEIVVLGGGEQ